MTSSQSFGLAGAERSGWISPGDLSQPWVSEPGPTTPLGQDSLSPPIGGPLPAVEGHLELNSGQGSNDL